MVRSIPRLRPSDSQRRRVKWLLPEAYEQWRDVGLAGYTADDDWDQSWRGRQDGRNVAFANTMWSTGLRLREAGTLLLLELPAVPVGRPPDRGRVAEAVAKRDGRDFWVPAETLRAIDGYRQSTRAEAIRRAQAAGRYDTLPGIMIASVVTPRRQLVYTDELGNEGVVPLDALNATDRCKVFVEGPDGLEPAMVWLTEAGMPMAYTSWQTVFRNANARCRVQGIDIHCYPHMLRHSFALRWLTVFIYAFDQRYGSHLRSGKNSGRCSGTLTRWSKCCWATAVARRRGRSTLSPRKASRSISFSETATATLLRRGRCCPGSRTRRTKCKGVHLDLIRRVTGVRLPSRAGNPR